jgi:hypothetical protein
VPGIHVFLPCSKQVVDGGTSPAMTTDRLPYPCGNANVSPYFFRIASR